MHCSQQCRCRHLRHLFHHLREQRVQILDLIARRRTITQTLLDGRAGDFAAEYWQLHRLRNRTDVRVTDRAGHTPASVAFAARQHATYAFLAEQEQKAVTSAVGLAHGEEDDGGGEEEVTRTPPRRRDLSGATE